MTTSIEIADVGERRPGWVWTICIFYLLSVAWTVLAFGMLLSGALPMTPGEKQYYSSLSAIDHASTVVLAVLNLWATVSLFMLRKRAYHLLAASFILGILLVVYNILAKHWLSVLSMPSLVGYLIGCLMNIGIIGYTRSLVKRGILT